MRLECKKEKKSIYAVGGLRHEYCREVCLYGRSQAPFSGNLKLQKYFLRDNCPIMSLKKFQNAYTKCYPLWCCTTNLDI